MTKCLICHGTEFYLSALSAVSGVVLINGISRIPVRCKVCLSCGYIYPNLDEDGLRRVRNWAKA